MSNLPSRLTAALRGRYAIERELGEGGMATVYLAEDVRHERKVALKVLRPELAAVLGAERFLAEIKTTANLQHPHILPLHDSGEVDGTVFYVMPFIEGESLRDRLVRERQLPVADAVRIATEVAGALDYAHRHGVIHRDIKPENILLHDGQALVADFGIALAASRAEGSKRLTETGISLGTPFYMSPEQAMGERDIDGRADVYALGCVLYEMLTGEPPHTGATAQAILGKVMTVDPSPPSKERKTVTAALDAAVLTALQKVPADRFTTAADFAAALEGRTHARPLSGAQRATVHFTPRRMAASVLLLGIGLAAGRWLLAPRAPSPVSYTRKTFHPEAIFNARFAPDGKTLVYSGATGTGSPQVYLVRPEYAERTPADLPPAQLLSVSSKGELAVLIHPEFLGHRLFQGTLARVPLGGGAPRALMDSVREADWSPDGGQLAVIRTTGGRDHLEFPVGTVLYESSGYVSDPRVSPDGKNVAFAEHPFRWDDRGLVRIVDLSGKTVASSPSFVSIEGMAWRPGSGEVLFGGAGTISVIQGLDLAGKTREILSGAGDMTMQDVSPGGQLLVTQDEGGYRLMLRAPGASEEVDVSWLNFSQSPAISRDGSMLAFGDGNAEPNYEVLLRHADADQVAQLGEGNPQGFSPDDSWILTLVPSTPPRLVLYPTGAGSERAVDVGTFENLGSADWFADGKSVLLCGNRTGDPPRCFVVSVSGGTPHAVTPPGTRGGRVSPDGREVAAYAEGVGYRLYSVASDGATDIRGLSADDYVARWSPDGRALYVWGRTSTSVDRLDLASGRRTHVLTARGSPGDGFTTLNSAAVADDPTVYAYILSPYVSKLFTVNGVVR